MSGITNWSEALAHPCFWALHYYPLIWNKVTDKDNFSLEAFFDCSDEQGKEFFRLLHGEHDNIPLSPDADDADDDYAGYYTPATSVLTLSFPENYTWTLEFFDGEVAHLIYEPQEPPWGLLVAVDGGNFCLPGLRWTEVKQMVSCLQPTWPGPFDLQALYLLLYPIVDPVSSAEYEEVRQTLGTAWEDLQMVKPSQLERLLDVSISVCEKGLPLWYDGAHGRQEDPSGSVKAEGLWLPDRAGDWFCIRSDSSRRYGDHKSFTPFFDMVERHTQPHT